MLFWSADKVISRLNASCGDGMSTDGTHVTDSLLVIPSDLLPCPATNVHTTLHRKMCSHHTPLVSFSPTRTYQRNYS